MSPLPAQIPNPAAHSGSRRGTRPAGSAAIPCCAWLASNSRHSSRASAVITAYRSPVPVSLQTSNTGPRQPGQMPNKNSGNAACNRTSSARIHGGAVCLPRSSARLSSARPQSYPCACMAPPASWLVTGGVSSSPAATSQPGFRICPEPWHSTHERRTHSAWPRLSVPTVQARRERWNFHPCPRQAKQISCRSLVLRMPSRLPTCRYEPITLGVLTVRWRVSC